MTTRRRFMQTVAVGAAALSLPVRALASRQQSTGYFGLHPFIENHPEAVFVMRTTVDQKMNSEAKKQAGLAFGRSVFVPRDESGIPLTMSIPVKANLKTADPKAYPMESIISHVADPWFVEGTFEGLKELGIAGSRIHLRDLCTRENMTAYGYVGVAERTGVDFRLDLNPVVTSLQAGRDFNWVDIPKGIFYKRIPYLEPINTPNTWMINISKFKAHGMGLTLCCKCLQGSAAHNYQQFCADWGASMSISQSDRQANAYDAIKANYDRHRASGSVPRWDRPGKDYNSGLGMETWVTRTLDNHTVTKCALHVIEGIYGRDGQGNGDIGPNPREQNHVIDDYGRSATGKAWDWMSNVIIFGKDPFRTDIIGHWLGGHEPGNFGLFHCAVDRGLSNALDPRKIPVYLWDNGAATLTPLENLPRTPLLTYYLPRTYNGQTENPYHLVDEPYDYRQAPLAVQNPASDGPRSLMLHQNHPNPFNPNTSIEYVLPKGGHVRLEIFTISGQLVEVLVDGYRAPGVHMAVWNAYHRASGTYVYRLRCGDFIKTQKMTLLK